MVDGVKIFAEEYYTLEGESCMILRAESVLKRIESRIGEGYRIPNLEASVDKALPYIFNVKNCIDTECEDTMITLEGFRKTIDASNDNIQNLKTQREDIRGGTSTRRQKRKKTIITVNMDTLEHITIEIVDAKVTLKTLLGRQKEAIDLHNKVTEIYSDCNKIFPIIVFILSLTIVKLLGTIFFY